jgi:hypothetical protein
MEKTTTIFALAGRRIDAVGTEVPRFPSENIELVRRRLLQLFEKHKPTALVSSAACGADLIALEEAGALGMRRRVVLPFDRDRFRQTSVVDRPGDWANVYDRIIAEVQLNGDLVTLSGDSSDTEAYAVASEAIFTEATCLGWRAEQDVRAVLVWDGVPRDEDDLTKLFGDEAKLRGIPIIEVKTI